MMDFFNLLFSLLYHHNCFFILIKVHIIRKISHNLRIKHYVFPMNSLGVSPVTFLKRRVK